MEVMMVNRRIRQRGGRLEKVLNLKVLKSSVIVRGNTSGRKDSDRRSVMTITNLPLSLLDIALTQVQIPLISIRPYRGVQLKPP